MPKNNSARPVETVRAESMKRNPCPGPESSAKTQLLPVFGVGETAFVCARVRIGCEGPGIRRAAGRWRSERDVLPIGERSIPFEAPHFRGIFEILP